MSTIKFAVNADGLMKLTPNVEKDKKARGLFAQAQDQVESTLQSVIDAMHQVQLSYDEDKTIAFVSGTKVRVVELGEPDEKGFLRNADTYTNKKGISRPKEIRIRFGEDDVRYYQLAINPTERTIMVFDRTERALANIGKYTAAVDPELEAELKNQSPDIKVGG